LAVSGGKAVFVDKDGTLVVNVPYNVDPERIALAPGAQHGLARLAGTGYQVIVVSNQPGAALGIFPEAALKKVEARLNELVPLDGFYYCPHPPGEDCGCRKPQAGLIERAAREHGVDLSSSWMIGDILDDVEAGRRAGCRTILLDVGHETEWQLNEQRSPHHIARDLSEAADIITAAS
jgi:D-glycero-D-manno-heptose 1,7-bisphosphate phosphatase